MKKIVFFSLIAIFYSNLSFSTVDPKKNPHMISISADSALKSYFKVAEGQNKNGTYASESNTFSLGLNYAYTIIPMIQLHTGISFEKTSTNKNYHSFDTHSYSQKSDSTLYGFEVGPIFNVLTDKERDIANSFYVSIILGYKKLTKSSTDQKSIRMNLGKRFLLSHSSKHRLSFSPSIYIKESRMNNSAIRSLTEQGINLLAFNLFL